MTTRDKFLTQNKNQIQFQCMGFFETKDKSRVSTPFPIFSQLPSQIPHNRSGSLSSYSRLAAHHIVG